MGERHLATCNVEWVSTTLFNYGMNQRHCSCNYLYLLPDGQRGTSGQAGSQAVPTSHLQVNTRWDGK